MSFKDWGQAKSSFYPVDTFRWMYYNGIRYRKSLTRKEPHRRRREGGGGATDLFTHNSRCGPGSLYYCYYSQVWSATSNNTHAREGIINEEITSLKENKEKIKIKNLISVLKMGTKSLLLLHLTVGRKMLATDGLHFCRSNHASIVQRGGGKSWFVFISFFRFWLLMKKENTSFMIYQIALKTYSNPKPFCGNWNF